MTKPETKTLPFWANVPPSGQIFRPKEFFARIGISRSQGYWMMENGLLPPFIKLSERASGMPESWLQAFLEHRAEATVNSINAVSKGETNPTDKAAKANARGIDQ